MLGPGAAALSGLSRGRRVGHAPTTVVWPV